MQKGLRKVWQTNTEVCKYADFWAGKHASKQASKL